MRNVLNANCTVVFNMPIQWMDQRMCQRNVLELETQEVQTNSPANITKGVFKYKFV